MCLIVYKQNEESKFSNHQFKSMVTRNQDGLGIMWRENGRVLTEKVVGSKADQFALWQKHRDKEEYAMHARLRTHGDVNEINCHPYEVLNMDKGDPIDLYMMHNGVISDAPNIYNNMSDTWHFVEYFIKPIAKMHLDELWNDKDLQVWISKKVGGSKLLFMRSDEVKGNSVLIFNYSLGTVDNKCWLSNTHSNSHTGFYYTGEGFLHTLPSPNTTYSGHNQNFCRTGGVDTKGTTKVGTTKSVCQTNTEYNWEKKLKDETKHLVPRGKLFLPDSSRAGKLIELTPAKVTISEHRIDPDEELRYHASFLKGLSMHAVKEWVKEDPDLAADMILAFYDKNTMPYDTIMREINNPNGIEGIVDIIRHVVSTDLYKKAS